MASEEGQGGGSARWRYAVDVVVKQTVTVYLDAAAGDDGAEAIPLALEYAKAPPTEGTTDRNVAVSGHGDFETEYIWFEAEYLEEPNR